MEDSVIESSAEEQDMLQRSTDKPIEAPFTQPLAWAGRSDVEMIQGRYPSIYIGEEDDNELHEFAEAIENLFDDEHEEDELIIPLDECLELWRPSKPLIIKLLGKNTLYNYLSQRLSNLWRAEG